MQGRDEAFVRLRFEAAGYENERFAAAGYVSDRFQAACYVRVIFGA